jgi:hypothetical protein
LPLASCPAWDCPGSAAAIGAVSHAPKTAIAATPIVERDERDRRVIVDRPRCDERLGREPAPPPVALKVARVFIRVPCALRGALFGANLGRDYVDSNRMT